MNGRFIIISRKLNRSYYYQKKYTYIYIFLSFVITKITLVIACCHYKINPEKIVSLFRGHRINIDETRFGDSFRIRGGEAAPKGDHRQKAEKGVSDNEEQPRGGRRGRMRRGS